MKSSFVFVNFTYEQLICFYTKEELIELYKNKFIVFTDIFDNEGNSFKSSFEKKLFNNDN